MKIKLIKDLDPSELEAFQSSQLSSVINKEFNFINSYLVYNQEYFGADYKDLSIVAYDKNDFYLAFFAFVNESTISCFKSPIKVFEIPATSKVLAFAYQNLFVKLEQLRDSLGLKEIYFDYNPNLLAKYFDSIKSKEIDVFTFIDLKQSVDEIKMNVRKSYKSLINWGNENLEIVLIDKNNPDKEKFDSFKRLHVQVAGRQTRSDLTWDLQYDGILKDQAYLVLGYLKGALVSGTFVIHGTQQAYYGVAVQDRNLMQENLPLGHAILMTSILKAKEKNLTTFIVGDVSASTDDKVNAIAKYKKGFSNTIGTNIKLLASL